MPNVTERPKRVSKELDKLEPGGYTEIIAGDERMLKLAPQMIKGRFHKIVEW